MRYMPFCGTQRVQAELMLSECRPTPWGWVAFYKCFNKLSNNSLLNYYSTTVSIAGEL